MTFEATLAKLNPRQREFVGAYLANGGRSTAAAREAGYASQSATNQGHLLKKNPLVLAAIAAGTMTAPPAPTHSPRNANPTRPKTVKPLRAKKDKVHGPAKPRVKIIFSNVKATWVSPLHENPVLQWIEKGQSEWWK